MWNVAEIRKPARVKTSVMPGAAEFARASLGFAPDEVQAAVLESEAKRGILNCSRQWGKSTVAAAKAVHRAYARPGSLVLVASPGERQSAEFVRKAREMVRRAGVEPRGDGDNPDFAAAAEPVADCGIAGERGDGTGIFGGVPAADRRGGEGGERDV